MAESIRYYADEHVAKAVVRGLRRRGIDVRTVAEAGLRGATDEEHLGLARSEGRVLFTQDDDFLPLDARGSSMRGSCMRNSGRRLE